MTSRSAARLAAGTPVIAAAHFRAEADPYHPARNPGGFVNLGTAENRLMWDLLAPKLTAPRALAPSDVHYGQLYGTHALRAMIAALLGRTWRRVLDPDDLVVVSGVTAALDIAATALCDPGDAIVVPAPNYSALEVDLAGRSGARVVHVPMPGRTADDPALLDRALTGLRRDGVIVRAVAVTSPSNPQGQVLSPSALRALLGVVAAHDLDLIADEIYAHSVFGDDPFTGVRDPDLEGVIDPRRVHVVWGFAKDFALPGLKVGVLHTTDASIRDAARALAYFAPTSTDTQALLRDLLADTAWRDRFFAENRSRLAASCRATAGALNARGIGFVPPAAGLSFWLDLRTSLERDAFDAEHELWRRLLDAKVNILPGRAFGAPEPGWFRLCHAVHRDLVRLGVRRLAAAVASTAGRSA